MEIPRGSLDTAPLIDLNIAREEQSNDYVNRKQQQQQSILLYRILFGVVGCCFAALYCAMGLLNLLTQRTHLLPKQYDLPLCSVIHFIATLSILSDVLYIQNDILPLSTTNKLKFVSLGLSILNFLYWLLCSIFLIRKHSFRYIWIGPTPLITHLAFLLIKKDLTLGTENSRSKKQSSQPKAI